jgi:hypothetical protein
VLSTLGQSNAGTRAVDLSRLGSSTATLRPVFAADVLAWVGGSLIGSCPGLQQALGSACVSVTQEHFVDGGRLHVRDCDAVITSERDFL